MLLECQVAVRIKEHLWTHEHTPNRADTNRTIAAVVDDLEGSSKDSWTVAIRLVHQSSEAFD